MKAQVAQCNDGALIVNGTAAFESCSVISKPKSFLIRAKKQCRAGLLQINNCEMPANLKSIFKDQSYKGSSCHEAPANLTLCNALHFINSYSVKNNNVDVRLGCNVQFDLSYKDICPK
ncbi:MAG: hypothetical protein EOP04_11685 [Proteobacteria bacterium]|nr:MAG: hypothetical protein EOP04_11685 [Pseudomonadota bacterium]